MNNTTISTAAASTGVAGAFVVVLQWLLLTFAGVHLTTDVGGAIVVVVGWLFHALAVYHVLPRMAAPATNPKAS